MVGEGSVAMETAGGMASTVKWMVEELLELFAASVALA